MYGTYDLTSKPVPGAIERDWTQKTLVMDMVNSIGEKFHTEILPGENPNNIPNIRRATATDNKGGNHTCLNMTFPIASAK